MFVCVSLAWVCPRWAEESLRPWLSVTFIGGHFCQLRVPLAREHSMVVILIVVEKQEDTYMHLVGVHHRTVTSCIPFNLPTPVKRRFGNSKRSCYSQSEEWGKKYTGNNNDTQRRKKPGGSLRSCRIDSEIDKGQATRHDHLFKMALFLSSFHPLFIFFDKRVNRLQQICCCRPSDERQAQFDGWQDMQTGSLRVT
jgi:hypothetical protein